MASNLLSIVLLMVAAFVSGAAESALPKVASVGIPILFSITLALAMRSLAIASILFAVVAGSVEDAVSGLPLFASVSFFVLVSGLVLWARIPRIMVLIAYPCYQLWLLLWVGPQIDNVWMRMLISVPIGIASVFLAGKAIMVIEEKAGIGGKE